MRQALGNKQKPYIVKNVPVISPYAGFLALTDEQWQQFRKYGYVKFACLPEWSFKSLGSDQITESIETVTFEKIQCGSDIAAKVSSGSPYRATAFIRNIDNQTRDRETV